MTSQEILDLVHNTRTPQIRAGTTHRFIDIWIVVVQDRMFCRQYEFSDRSWYAAFQRDSYGEIKCGDTIIKVIASIPSDIEDINPAVNEAYIEKYDKRFHHYPDTAHEMTQPRFMSSTMELIPLDVE